ncbi:MAG: S46 family peptidase [Clostridiales bacterium]|nr:S46 family peptidase [Clostridiales bacterium]
MKISRLISCLAAVAGILTFLVFADDGMWMPHQMKDLDLKRLGLKMDPQDLYKKDGTGLMSAVVSLGGGTGEFVSADGLILTNHHVAFGAIQRASTTEKDYIRDGFLARTRSEEIPAQGYIADVLLGYEEVTHRMRAAIKPGMTYRDIYEAVEKAEKEMIAAAEKEGQDLRCTIARMYSGNQYYLFRFKRIRDIRLVYAPPQDLGNFGGEVDNWMWPRHTCDFSFLRAYVSKEGVGVEYNPANVPYKPKSILKISLQGVREGDFTFVMGYPGRTYRNFTLSEVKFEKEVLSQRMDEYKDIIAFYEKASQGHREVEIKYASRLRGLYNSLKNYQGKLEGMERVSLIKRKEAYEKEFMGWVSDEPARLKRYGDVLAKVEAFMDRHAEFHWKNDFLSGMTGSTFGSTILSQGYLILRTVEERQKPDSDRDPFYQDRNLPYIKQSIQLAERSYDLPTDRAFLKHRLKKLLQMPDSRVPAAFQEIVAKKSEKAIEDFVDELYSKTILVTPEKRLELISFKPDELDRLEDPVISLAAELEKELRVLREEGKALSQERAELKKIYEEALLSRSEGRFAPDANGTIRFTYGPVEGYSPRNAVFYSPLTTLKGVMEKETGEFPFRVPAKLKELFHKKDFGRYEAEPLKDVVCCFLNTTNVTGGNSGSPTLNARGEQVGIIFDMTYESVIGDYYILPELQRSISVDIRYVLFITEKFSGAGHIIKELGL